MLVLSLISHRKNLPLTDSPAASRPGLMSVQRGAPLNLGRASLAVNEYRNAS